MAIREVFWFLAGVAAAIAALLIAVPLWRAAPDDQGLRTRLLLPTGISVIVIAAAIVLYMRLGAPRSMDSPIPAPAQVLTEAHAAEVTAGAQGGGAGAGSLEDAARQLAQRLERDGGSAADWELLAQSYEFLGRTAEAQQARERGKSAPATAQRAPAPSAGTPAAAGAPRPFATPPSAPAARLTGKAGELRNRAEEQRRARDFQAAAATFAQLAAIGGMDADTWADYADAQASAQKGSLAGKPAEFLAQALKLDPDHPKALWLQATLFLEQRDYRRALETWEHLAAVMPPDSPDTRIVAANIAETRRLGGLPVLPTSASRPAVSASTAAAAAPATSGAAIRGELDLAAPLRAQVSPGTPLFIYARAVDSPGPPLAVLRIATGTWPVRFVLDDTMAMMPDRRLSAFSSVTIEARISKSGDATPKAGDLQGRTAPLDPRRAPTVRLVIDRAVS